MGDRNRGPRVVGEQHGYAVGHQYRADRARAARDRGVELGAPAKDEG